jgi:hypothetical protein
MKLLLTIFVSFHWQHCGIEAAKKMDQRTHQTLGADAKSKDGENAGEGRDPLGEDSAASKNSVSEIGGSTSPNPLYLTFSWEPGPQSGLTAYRIYLKDESDAGGSIISNVSSASVPSIRIDAASNSALSQLIGTQACFYVVAISAGGESPPSDPSCLVL